MTKMENVIEPIRERIQKYKGGGTDFESNTYM